MYMGFTGKQPALRFVNRARSTRLSRGATLAASREEAEALVGCQEHSRETEDGAHQEREERESWQQQRLRTPRRPLAPAPTRLGTTSARRAAGGATRCVAGDGARQQGEAGRTRPRGSPTPQAGGPTPAAGRVAGAAARVRRCSVIGRAERARATLPRPERAEPTPSEPPSRARETYTRDPTWWIQLRYR